MDFATTGSVSSQLPHSPRIIFKENSNISYISLSSTDAFSLNTFDELVEEHSQLSIDGDPDQRRCLIIARVRTWDESTQRYFDSYYNAWHLNKILFRTETSSNRTFIHRLSVSDPMTNAEIVKVEYFKTGNPSLSGEARSSKPFDVSSSVTTTSIHISDLSPLSSKSDMRFISRLEPSSVVTYCIGTDDDYMKSKALRKCFHQNAISVEDAELFTLQPHDPASYLVGNEWTRLAARNADGRFRISCSPVDTLLQAAGVLFCCALYYVQIEEEEEYGLEQQSLIGGSEELQDQAGTTAHDYWQPVSAVNDLTLTFSA
ncbi:hypothetical protein BC943DRAFT_153000 [Umbelopsis sp. AD052]|nr:hypothetical protein BC943DRAFT_153000 [Umbelopsis sp. AD052]